MKCPTCQAWTRVLATRDTVRRRKCAEGHLFSSKEILYAAPSEKIAVKRQAALKHLAEGWKPLAAAHELGVSERTVRAWRARHL